MRTAPETARLASILRQLPPPRSVLELGCGNSPDGLYFYGAGDSVPLLVGLDKDSSALRAANGSSLYLLQADITRLPFRLQFDRVIVRHPDIDHHTIQWHNLLDLAPDLLNNNGTLLITTYSLPEMEQINVWLASTRLVKLPLPVKQLVPPGLQGRDRFILCWRNSLSVSNV
jgi:SAM-dependent methyltransferase